MIDYNPTITVLVILIIAFVAYSTINSKEHYSGTGALTQLYAKGPQDLYLTDDAKKYIYYDYHYPYVESVWNNSTRKVPYYPYYHLNYYNHPNLTHNHLRYPPYLHYLNNSRQYVFPFLWY